MLSTQKSAFAEHKRIGKQVQILFDKAAVTNDKCSGLTPTARSRKVEQFVRIRSQKTCFFVPTKLPPKD